MSYPIEPPPPSPLPLKGTPYIDLLLREGEMLYIPPNWWHFVEADEMSFSVSFWWT